MFAKNIQTGHSLMKNKLSESDILVSIILCCRNESKYIKKTVETLLSQKNILGKFELIVVDGISTDGTREMLSELESNHKNLIVVENEKKITPAALNLGILHSRGEFICVVGAHAEYSSDYINNCLLLFQKHPGASCVGGPIISKGRNNFAKATALAMSSFLGIGNAKHRFPNYEGEAEMACFPMFKREVFTRIGLYDESLIRNQDDEFCLRLRLNGDKIIISPVAKSVYYVRDTPIKLFSQYFQYGFYRIAVIKKHKMNIAIRHLVPALFIFCLILSLVFAIIFNFSIFTFSIPLLYFFSLILFSIPILYKEKILIGVYFILAIPILHFSYGLGFISGVFYYLLKWEIFHPHKQKID